MPKTDASLCCKWSVGPYLAWLPVTSLTRFPTIVTLHSATATGVSRLLHFLSLFLELSSPRCPIAHSLISFKPVFSCHLLRGPLYLEFQALSIPFLLYFPPCTMLSLFSPSVMSDSLATPWTVAHQSPLSVGFPRQE